MNKIIWSCWFQGRDAAPPLVQACLRSWDTTNPGWSFRCLDATTASRYVDLNRFVDLNRQAVTAPSLSDILRIALLHEFGGVWVDATLFCNRPLDQWLTPLMAEGFFAFAQPAPDRMLSSWFLAAESDNPLIGSWCRLTRDYWGQRPSTDDYFWFHHLFGDLCESDADARAMWSRVPKVSADAPHSFQFGGSMLDPASAASDRVDWSAPVFKLTYRVPDIPPDCLLGELLARHPEPARAPSSSDEPLERVPATQCFGSLKVSTENLGDHIQIIAGLNLLRRLGVRPSFWIDRDHELDSNAHIEADGEPAGILLNGWFKSGSAGWPPHPGLLPVLCGFHLRPWQAPGLLEEESLRFFRSHQPIGCRDRFTHQTLAERGIDSFVSNCLSLTLPKRIAHGEPSEVFVVSRDPRLCAVIPSSFGDVRYISHYSGSTDFEGNMAEAERLLSTYATGPRLIVTTLLHCALPAIAMGIPVVVFYPVNDASGHQSDIERFSSLSGLVPIHDLDDLEPVDWSPKHVDAGLLKLRVLDNFYRLSERWNLAPAPPLGPIAPAAMSN